MKRLLLMALLVCVGTLAGCGSKQTGEDSGSTEPGRRIVLGLAGCKPGYTCYPCFTCHGVRGEGSGLAAFPRLAGQDGRYLRSSLQRFATGERANDTMRDVARALADRQIDQVVAYFAALDTPALPVVIPDPQRQDAQTLGKQIDQQGIPERGVPPCMTCHSLAVRKSGAAYPDISGQYAAYLVTQLEHFRDGSRRGADAPIMQTIARGLSEQQSWAVSTYYSLMSSQPSSPVLNAQR